MATAVDNLVHDVWHIAAVGVGLLLSVLATRPAVLNKRDSRAAIARVGFVWLWALSLWQHGGRCIPLTGR